MAILETNGLAELSISFAELANIRSSGVLERMLVAGAEIVKRAQQSKARAYGVHRLGITEQSIDYGKITQSGSGVHIFIYPKGTRHDGNDRRTGEVAFINEFGKRGQPPRPFIRDANEASIDEATEAAKEVYDSWLTSVGL